MHVSHLAVVGIDLAPGCDVGVLARVNPNGELMERALVHPVDPRSETVRFVDLIGNNLEESHRNPDDAYWEARRPKAPADWVLVEVIGLTTSFGFNPWRINGIEVQGWAFKRSNCDLIYLHPADAVALELLGVVQAAEDPLDRALRDLRASYAER